MSEYIIEWSGIGARITELVGSETPCLAVKHLREERLREEIVRCRDCKHFTPKGTHKFENGKVNADFCEYIRGWMLQITPDGFCAWAERKEA